MRYLFFTAGLVGWTAVALGAFGAHALRDSLGVHGKTLWQTANLYHLVHAAALIGLLSLVHHRPEPRLFWAGWGFVCGTVLFSGSLYGMALGGGRWLGPMTPLGGLIWLWAWGTIAWSAYVGR